MTAVTCSILVPPFLFRHGLIEFETAADDAAMKRGDLDGSIMDVGNAYALERAGEGRILVRFGDISDFLTHVIFGTDKIIAEKTADVKAAEREAALTKLEHCLLKSPISG